MPGIMKKHVVLCAALLAIASCNKKKSDEAGASSTSTAPPPAEKMVAEPPKKAPEPPAPDPKLVERGAYLVKAGACVVCHTAMGPKGPDLANAFAGGLEMPDAIGTWRSPNITQDKGTGIGNWTDDQIAAAIREGVRPDNTQLFPIMPFMNYNRLTDADTKAIVAFLRTIKPIEKVVAPNKDLKMPKMAAPKPANAPDVTTDPVKHGEYIASVMLCNHCHWTPDKNMAPAGPDKMFSGGLPMDMPMLGTGHLWTRNITSDPETGIGKWTEEQIYTAIKTMAKPDGKMIQGPMLFMQGTWSQLDDADLKAVAAFIKKLPPVKNKVPDSTFKPTAMGGPPPGGAPPGEAPKGDAPKGDAPKGDAPKGDAKKPDAPKKS
jgi:mono/diheme cytochrome c family protein